MIRSGSIRGTLAHIEGETIIGRSPEVVFDFVADERNEPKYNPHMIWAELISGGEIGIGSQLREATQSMGRALEMTIEWTEYERPRASGRQLGCSRPTFTAR